MQLKCAGRVATGTHVRVVGETMEVVGSIVYCRAATTGYLVGIEMSRAPHEKNCSDDKE